MNVQEIKRYNRRCSRREAALLKRGNAVTARIAAPSEPASSHPDNVEDIALSRKLKAFGAAKAAEHKAQLTFAGFKDRMTDPTYNIQEWVTARDQLHAAMEASVQALEAFVAQAEAEQRQSQ